MCPVLYNEDRTIDGGLMSTGMSIVSKDTVMKEIFADPEFFADLFNGNFLREIKSSKQKS